MIVRALLGLGGAPLLVWRALILTVVVARPRGDLLQQALRLLPDLLRLLRRLAGDRSLPQGIRVRLWLLLAYLAIPIDVVPDVIPVLGYADDAIIVTAVLRLGRAPGRPGGTAPALARNRRWPCRRDPPVRARPPAPSLRRWLGSWATVRLEPLTGHWIEFGSEGGSAPWSRRTL